MWIKSKEGLFNSSGYRSIVAEHFASEGLGDKPMSVVVGRLLGGKKRDKGADPEPDPFEMIAIYEGKGCIHRANQAVEWISSNLGQRSSQCDVGWLDPQVSR
jgi:hypothetical protein